MNPNAQIGKSVASAAIEFVFLLVFLFSLLFAGEYLNKTALVASISAPGPSKVLVQTNQSFVFQFVNFLIGIFTGKWGYFSTSMPHFSGFSVTALIGYTLPATAFLLVISTLAATPIVILLGIRYGKRVHTPTSTPTSVYTGLGASVPAFFLVLLAQLAFRNTALGTSGMFAGTYYLTMPTHIPLIDGLISKDFNLAGSAALHLVLPFLILVFFISALLLRTYRAGILKTLDSGYLSSAKALGLPSWIITRRYLMNTGTSEILRHISSLMTAIFTLDIIVETVFLYQGMGWLFFESAIETSFTGIIGTLLVYGTGLIIIRFISRLSRNYIDPQRMGGV